MEIDIVKRGDIILETFNVPDADLQLSHPSHLSNRTMISPFTKAGYETEFVCGFPIQEGDIIYCTVNHGGNKSSCELLVLSVTSTVKKTLARKPVKYTLFTFKCRVVSNIKI